MNFRRKKVERVKKRRAGNKGKKAPPKSRQRRTKKAKTIPHNSAEVLSKMKRNLQRVYVVEAECDKHSGVTRWCDTRNS